MTHEEIREAIKQVQVQAMSLHRYNLEIAASTMRANSPLWVERLEWWGVVLLASLIGSLIGMAHAL